eukprot:6195305-Pleurochrysis_carterae.AAC.2
MITANLSCRNAGVHQATSAPEAAPCLMVKLNSLLQLQDYLHSYTKHDHQDARHTLDELVLVNSCSHIGDHRHAAHDTHTTLTHAGRTQHTQAQAQMQRVERETRNLNRHPHAGIKYTRFLNTSVVSRAYGGPYLAMDTDLGRPR